MFDYNAVRKAETYGIKKYSDALYRGEIQSGKR